MTSIHVMRTDVAMPSRMDTIRDFLFGSLDGFNKDDKRAWRRLWARIRDLAPGEMLRIDVVQPRSGPYHRRHMAMEQAIYDAQERFTNFDQFRDWLKIGAGWVDWVPGAKGGIVPLPKSISYAKADQDEFVQFHEAVVAFLREGHAARFLWKHLGDRAQDMMDSLLQEFGE